MDSPTDTVIALRLLASAPSSTMVALPMPFPRIPTQLSATSPEPSPSIVTSGCHSAWSLMGKTQRRGEKEEEKRRKKEEALSVGVAGGDVACWATTRGQQRMSVVLTQGFSRWAGTRTYPYPYLRGTGFWRVRGRVPLPAPVIPPDSHANDSNLEKGWKTLLPSMKHTDSIDTVSNPGSEVQPRNPFSWGLSSNIVDFIVANDQVELQDNDILWQTPIREAIIHAWEIPNWSAPGADRQSDDLHRRTSPPAVGSWHGTALLDLLPPPSPFPSLAKYTVILVKPSQGGLKTTTGWSPSQQNMEPVATQAKWSLTSVSRPPLRWLHHFDIQGALTAIIAQGLGRGLCGTRGLSGGAGATAAVPVKPSQSGFKTTTGQSPGLPSPHSLPNHPPPSSSTRPFILSAPVKIGPLLPFLFPFFSPASQQIQLALQVVGHSQPQHSSNVRGKLSGRPSDGNAPGSMQALARGLFGGPALLDSVLRALA
ncbi:hypothetical protein BC826DRAFT_1126161 [Russula brevipes]|nr:hypothetical protein BC826DRAFT_1126161 [Russula brevipes]